MQLCNDNVKLVTHLEDMSRAFGVDLDDPEGFLTTGVMSHALSRLCGPMHTSHFKKQPGNIHFAQHYSIMPIQRGVEVLRPHDNKDVN